MRLIHRKIRYYNYYQLLKHIHAQISIFSDVGQNMPTVFTTTNKERSGNKTKRQTNNCLVKT